jgi:hypothetical protein
MSQSQAIYTKVVDVPFLNPVSHMRIVHTLTCKRNLDTASHTPTLSPYLGPVQSTLISDF